MSTDYLQPPPNGTFWLTRATAGSLCAAARLNVAGLILAALNLHVAVETGPNNSGYATPMAASLLGAAQLYLLVRIEIDRRLFDVLGAAPDAGDLAALDYALTVLGWNHHKRNNCSLQARSCGAIRFLPLAGAMAGFQLLTLWLFLLMG